MNVFLVYLEQFEAKKSAIADNSLNSTTTSAPVEPKKALPTHSQVFQFPDKYTQEEKDAVLSLIKSSQAETDVAKVVTTPTRRALRSAKSAAPKKELFLTLEKGTLNEMPNSEVFGM